MKTNIRSVKVTYADGNIIYTDMSAGLTDNEILSYFAVRKVFDSWDCATKKLFKERKISKIGIRWFYFKYTNLKITY